LILSDTPLVDTKNAGPRFYTAAPRVITRRPAAPEGATTSKSLRTSWNLC